MIQMISCFTGSNGCFIVVSVRNGLGIFTWYSKIKISLVLSTICAAENVYKSHMCESSFNCEVQKHWLFLVSADETLWTDWP